ncbi:PREDICTED: uncharacterized protein LOC109190215 isoform X1 [Ipomoea nil]|uniref:uncharacterized protein LOC109190215 isoform X1 n=1 Tax=Ipomoea nil TaxID=35883 RepID=UPI000900DE3C|nr:PREDICTED: uncharacterized protein LOC109190215 isoform X1 [Ipomoea nil]
MLMKSAPFNLLLFIKPYGVAIRPPAVVVLRGISLIGLPPLSGGRNSIPVPPRANRSQPLSVVKMESACETKPSPAVVKLKPIEATPETFREFGQVIEASPDGEEFGPRDAQLDLSRGVPRFYIMQLKGRSLKFSSITHHANVTQCLGSIGGNVWYLGVAKSSIVDPSEIKGETGVNIQQSDSGHFYVPPAVDEVHAFKISGSKFIKLNRGTWHAGPLFNGGVMDFYNLELNNTNVVDHTTHYFSKKNNVVFHLEE